MRVLYLEDEPVLGKIVKESLEQRECTIAWFKSADAATAALADASAFDVAVLDVQLPGRSGFEVGKELRIACPDLPIIYLTARVEAKDAVAGFAAGGDDYVRKPFSMEELLVRMQNLVALRSREDLVPALVPQELGPPPDVLLIGRTRFDYRNLQLGEHRLSHREAELLRYLLRHRHRDVIERRELLLTLWGDDGFFHSRNLDVYISKLRTYLVTEPRISIITLRGVGYRCILASDTTIPKR